MAYDENIALGGLTDGRNAGTSMRDHFCINCFQRIFVREQDTLCPICGDTLPSNVNEQQARGLSDVLAAQLTQQHANGEQGENMLRSALQMSLSGVAPESTSQTPGAAQSATMLAALLQERFADVPTQPKEGASAKAIEKLRIHVPENDDDIPHQVSLSIAGVGSDIAVIPAAFGPKLHDMANEQEVGTQTHMQVLSGPLVVCNPLSGQNLQNESALNGAIAIARRGDISFAQKARNVQSTGAKALLVIQTHDVWPYTMTDTATNGEGITIPVVMIRGALGERLVKLLARVSHHDNKTDDSNSAKETAEKKKSLIGILRVRGQETSCPITRETFQKGDEIAEMPCGHLFSRDGLMMWLDTHHTCPLCRFQLENQDSTDHAEELNEDGPGGVLSLWYT